MKPDKKSKTIILKAYWGSGGWKTPPQFSENDVAHLRRTGYLFRSTPLTHDEAICRLLRARDALSKSAVVNAFVASLSTRELEYRSPLGSYAHALHLIEHAFEPVEHLHSKFCATCGLPPRVTADLSILNFERLKWGGVRHDEITFEMFDLEQLAEQEPRVPTQADWESLARILDLAASAPQSVTSLKRSLGSVLSSNDPERDVLCHILAYLGVLAPVDCPSYHTAYVPFARRGDGRPRSDQRYPLSWWTGGLNPAAVEFWFPQLTE